MPHAQAKPSLVISRNLERRRAALVRRGVPLCLHRLEAPPAGLPVPTPLLPHLSSGADGAPQGERPLVLPRVGELARPWTVTAQPSARCNVGKSRPRSLGGTGVGTDVWREEVTACRPRAPGAASRQPEDVQGPA
uniref:Uncharacterized protein n=1 Tax=Rousettus aegyptiacus TaxID=9407 RepID=A0A7J8F150_ROUAE|nr:hypothetical protein HJG63_012431 [Rousettus aegyptiacus]